MLYEPSPNLLILVNFLMFTTLVISASQIGTGKPILGTPNVKNSFIVTFSMIKNENLKFSCQGSNVVVYCFFRALAWLHYCYYTNPLCEKKLG